MKLRTDINTIETISKLLFQISHYGLKVKWADTEYADPSTLTPEQLKEDMGYDWMAHAEQAEDILMIIDALPLSALVGSSEMPPEMVLTEIRLPTSSCLDEHRKTESSEE